MNVRWAPGAIQDREDIGDYIAKENPPAAVRMDDLFDEAAAGLAEFPKLGREGRVPGTRELIPHKSYRLVYEIRNDDVVITAVIHTSRQWPPPAE